MYQLARPYLFSALLLLLVLSGCAQLTKSWASPELSMAGFRLGEITPDRQTFIISLKVKNPNDRILPVNGATYALEVEGHEIANGSGGLDRQIPAFGEEVVDVEVNTQLLDLIRKVPELVLTGGRWDYRISGILKLAGGYLPVPFNYGGEVEAADLMRLLGDRKNGIGSLWIPD